MTGLRFVLTLIFSLNSMCLLLLFFFLTPRLCQTGDELKQNPNLKRVSWSIRPWWSFSCSSENKGRSCILSSRKPLINTLLIRLYRRKWEDRTWIISLSIEVICLHICSAPLKITWSLLGFAFYLIGGPNQFKWHQFYIFRFHIYTLSERCTVHKVRLWLYKTEWCGTCIVLATELAYCSTTKMRSWLWNPTHIYMYIY